MHRDRTSEYFHIGKGASRKEWDRPALRDHDDGRDRPPRKGRKGDGARHDEALRQIRELRARY